MSGNDRLTWTELFGLIPDLPYPEPTFTLTQVQQIVEGIAVKVEGLARMLPILEQKYLVARVHVASYTDDDNGELLIREEVLATIRSTKI